MANKINSAHSTLNSARVIQDTCIAKECKELVVTEDGSPKVYCKYHLHGSPNNINRKAKNSKPKSKYSK